MKMKNILRATAYSSITSTQFTSCLHTFGYTHKSLSELFVYMHVQIQTWSLAGVSTAGK